MTGQREPREIIEEWFVEASKPFGVDLRKVGELISGLRAAGYEIRPISPIENYQVPSSVEPPVTGRALELAHDCRWPDSRVDLARLFDWFGKILGQPKDRKEVVPVDADRSARPVDTQPPSIAAGASGEPAQLVVEHRPTGPVRL